MRSALGVGIATIIAQAAAWLFGIYYINRKYPQYRISLLHIGFDKAILKQAVKLGLPAGLQQMLFSIGVLAMSALINSYDDAFVSGFTAANKIDSFAFMPITSFASAATTFVGQNVGAGRECNACGRYNASGGEDRKEQDQPCASDTSCPGK